MRPDVVGHPGIFGILHLTYYVLGHTKSFFWHTIFILERRAECPATSGHILQYALAAGFPGIPQSSAQVCMSKRVKVQGAML